MTYRELLYKATRLADKSEITLGEYEEMTKPLDREVEQEPILDKIRAEIKGMTLTYHNPDWSITDLVPISEVLKLVDKYKAESEVENGNDN